MFFLSFFLNLVQPIVQLAPTKTPANLVRVGTTLKMTQLVEVSMVFERKIFISIVCPTHCSSCTSSSVCTSCNSGYGIYGNLCMLCPSGTYLTTDQICKGKSIYLFLKRLIHILNRVFKYTSRHFDKFSAFKFRSYPSFEYYLQRKCHQLICSHQWKNILSDQIPQYLIFWRTSNRSSHMETKLCLARTNS